MASLLLYGNVNHARVSMDHFIATAKSLGVDFLCVTEPFASGGRISAPGWNQWMVGRSAILIRSNIRALQIPTTAPETVCISLGTFTLLCTYISPNSYIGNTLGPLEADLQMIQTPMLLVGDFNCRTNLIPGQVTNNRGEAFEDFILANQLVIRNTTTPTWRRNNQHGINDYFCSRGLNADVEVLEDIASLSDHSFVLTTLDTHPQVNVPPPKLDKEALAAAIEQHVFAEPEDLNTPEAIDEYVSALTSELQLLLAESSEPRLRPASPIPWWSPALDRLKTAVNRVGRMLSRLRKQANFDPTSLQFKILTALLKIMTRVYRNQISRAKLEAWRKFIACKTPWGKPYKIIKALNRGRSQIPALRRQDGSRCGSIAENTELLLTAKFGDSPAPDVQPPTQFTSGPPEKITAASLAAIIKRLNNKKACGPDNIPVSLVKLLHRHHPRILPRLFTACLTVGYFPSLWKIGRAVFICKPSKDATSAESYRPITLLSFIGKVFERVLNDTIVLHLELTEGLHSAQYGFRRFLGAENAVHAALREITTCRGNHLLTAALSCDIRGAFDNADWNAILQATALAHLPHFIGRTLTSYFSHRRVQSEGQIKHLSRGCPQGSILGPTLWNVIHDSVIRQLQPLCEGLVCFADDTLLILGAADPVQLATRCETLLGLFNNFLAANGLVLNASKTEFLVFRNVPLRIRRRQPHLTEDPVLHVDGATINPSPFMRYLGVYLDPKLTFNNHLEQCLIKCRRSMQLLHRLCPNVHGYHPAARRVMVQGAVYAHLYYCSSTWYHRLKLRDPRTSVLSLQRQCDRMITSAYRTVSGSAIGVIAASPPLDLLLIRRSIRWLQKQQLPVPYWHPFVEPPAIADDPDDPAPPPPPPDWHGPIMDQWQQRWNESLTGRWTYSLFPDIASRLRLKFVHTFFRTQGLTGHGVFGKYLETFKRRPTSFCSCGFAEETPAHVFLDCPLHAISRPQQWNEISVEHVRYIGRTVNTLWMMENPDVLAPGSSSV